MQSSVGLNVFRIKFTLVIIITIVISICLSATARFPAVEPVVLTVFLYDDCGGCGANNPGCGECVKTDRIHNALKVQFGDRLYDGSIEYRLLNCRIDANDIKRIERSELFGVNQDMLNARPILFIGDHESGVYIPGEILLTRAGDAFDRLVRGENAEFIQRDINTRFYSLIQ